MRSVIQILLLGRDRVRSFALVAVLVSLGTGATLLEPWIYRSIIDDIAGTFVTPRALARADTAVNHALAALSHLDASGDRMFRLPMAPFVQHDGAARALQGRTAHEAAATVVLGALMLIVIRLVAEWFKRLGDNRAAQLASDVERDFILRTFGHVVRLPLGFFTRRASSAIARQIDQSNNVAPIFTAVAQDLWPDLFRLVAVLAIMLVSNHDLALVAAVTVLAYGAVTWRVTRMLDAEADQYYEQWDELSNRIQEAVAGIKTVQTHGAEAHETARVEAASREAYALFLHRKRIRNRYSYVQDAIISASKACVLAVGGLKALEHQLTPGDVVMFLAYLDRLYSPIEGLTSLYSGLQQHVASVRRAQRLLKEATVADANLPPLRPGAGAVRFENVSFAYSPEHTVLDGVTFELQPRKRTALVGPSGAGKTTMTDLLVGLYRPRHGQVLVDGQRIDRVSPASVRAVIRNVAPDGALFRMSVGDNIRYGRLGASDAEIREAASLAGLDPVLARLPEGLNTLVGERGMALSLGERQRILLARAFLARPTILILDEATANLDFRTEASLKRALSVISEGRTTLLIAHRRSMLTDVDRVLVLHNGRIEQDGTPEELMSRDGYFRDMMTATEAAPDE